MHPPNVGGLWEDRILCSLAAKRCATGLQGGGSAIVQAPPLMGGKPAIRREMGQDARALDPVLPLRRLILRLLSYACLELAQQKCKKEIPLPPWQAKAAEYEIKHPLLY